MRVVSTKKHMAALLIKHPCSKPEYEHTHSYIKAHQIPASRWLRITMLLLLLKIYFLLLLLHVCGDDRRGLI